MLSSETLSLIQQAVNAHKKGEVRTAIDFYEKALDGLPKGEKNLLLHLKLAGLYSQIAEDKIAISHYHDALKIDEGSIQAHYQLGLHFLRTQAYEHAIIQFKNVIAIDDNANHAYFHLGVAYFQNKQLEEAQPCFEQVLKNQPEDVEAWVNLGAIAMAENKNQQAIDYFTRALTFNPDYEPARSNLAATFMHFNRYENALTHYLLLLEQFIDNPEYLYQAALCEMTLGQLDAAYQKFLKILENDPTHFAVLYNLAVLSMRLDKKARAQDFLTRALLVKPGDASCRHLLASLSGGKSTFEEGMVHAQRLFDQYAMYYDNHMLNALHYQLPTMIFSLLQTVGLIEFGQVLDLGCGTGLCAEQFKEVSQSIIGVDISKPMLERAEEKGCYVAYIEQEATTFLEETDLRFDLIVAADLFPYFGDLAPCLVGIKRCLTPKGYTIFTVEKSEVAPWVLQQTARYAHDVKYVEAVCQQVGLKVVSLELKKAREQKGGWVEVWMFLCRL